LIFIFSRLGAGPRGRGGNAYFYDLSTGTLFNADAQTPPIDSPTGSKGAEAHVFSCGQCDDESARFTAYIVIYEDDARAELDKANPNIEALEAGHKIAEPSTSPKWVTYGSPKGARLRETPYKKCDSPTQCHP